MTFNYTGPAYKVGDREVAERAENEFLQERENELLLHGFGVTREEKVSCLKVQN